METKLNIAEILKDKPKGTKLYSSLFRDVYLSYVKSGIINAEHHGEITKFDYNGKYFSYPESESLVFPSKEMHDWSKFTWKKGDVLVSKGRRTLHVIFEGFNNDTYTTFKGKYYICDYSNKKNCDDEEYYNDYHKEVKERTIEFEKDNVNNAQTYINIIEKRLGGKLNLETLEIEKIHPEFKDGDIVSAVFTDGDEMVCVFKEKIEQDYMGYCGFFSKGKHKGDVIMDLGDDCICNDSPICKEIRLATEEEKQQLFDALVKEGKTWDAEKKQVVDLKPKVELKPFDKVLVKDSKSDYWRATLFSHINENGCYYCVWAGWTYCILYEGNEHLLGTNKDVED